MEGKLEDDMLGLGRRLAGAEQELRGVVRFTTVLELFVRLAPDLARFRSMHPGIRLETTTEARVLRLGRHEADVALRPGRAPTEPDVVGRRLSPSPIAVYAAPAYLEAHGRPVDVASLEGHALVGYRTDRPAGEVVLRVDSRVAQAAACRAGVGLAMLPRFLGDPDPGLEALFEVPVADIGLWLLTHRDLVRAARVRAFMAFLTERLGS